MKRQFLAEWQRLKIEHTHDRDQRQEYYEKLRESGVDWNVQAFDPLDPYASL
ncbi:MAG: hypothetical protein QMD76_04065 [Anaerosomatales bacterium]|nr:hypothetical protein [Anaerosomatales bacterium]